MDVHHARYIRWVALSTLQPHRCFCLPVNTATSETSRGLSPGARRGLACRTFQYLNCARPATAILMKSGTQFIWQIPHDASSAVLLQRWPPHDRPALPFSPCNLLGVCQANGGWRGQPPCLHVGWTGGTCGTGIAGDGFPALPYAIRRFFLAKPEGKGKFWPQPEGGFWTRRSKRFPPSGRCNW